MTLPEHFPVLSDCPEDDLYALKPCPFCGGDGPYVNLDDFAWWVVCGRGSCMAEGSHQGTEREAIAAWNKRESCASK